jgi:predicted DNA-binding protein (MmcQ/YjbR family)
MKVWCYLPDFQVILLIQRYVFAHMTQAALKTLLAAVHMNSAHWREIYMKELVQTRVFEYWELNAIIRVG